jgi:hypothetical protein
VRIARAVRRLRLPLVSLAADYLLRRNVLTYKAPPLHPPGPRRQRERVIRVQVKSRYATDCDRGFLVKGKTIDAFDFLVCPRLQRIALNCDTADRVTFSANGYLA